MLKTQQSHKFIVSEEGVKSYIVKKIFQLYGEDGYSYNEIISYLKERGYKTRQGNDFSKSGIFEYFRNKKLNGTHLYNQRAKKSISGTRNNHKYKDESDIVSIVGGCPKIIDDELYAKVQARLALNKNTRSDTKEYYMLKDKIFCGDCKNKMAGNRRKSGRNKTMYVSYYCTGRAKKNGCLNRDINKEYIENFVIRQLKISLFSKNHLKQLRKELLNYTNEEKQTISREEIKQCKSRLRGINAKIKNILSIIERVGAHEDVMSRLTELQSLKQNTEIQMCELKDSVKAFKVAEAEIVEAIKGVKKVLLNKDDISSRRIINNYVEKVLVYNDGRIEVVLRLPRTVNDKYLAS